MIDTPKVPDKWNADKSAAPAAENRIFKLFDKETEQFVTRPKGNTAKSSSPEELAGDVQCIE